MKYIIVFILPILTACRQGALSEVDYKILIISDSLMIQQKKLHDEWHFRIVDNLIENLTMHGNGEGRSNLTLLKNTWDKYQLVSGWIESAELTNPKDTLLTLSLFSNEIEYVSEEQIEKYSLEQPFQESLAYPFRSNAQLNLALEDHYRIILDFMKYQRYLTSNYGNQTEFMTASNEDVTRIYLRAKFDHTFLERLVIPESSRANLSTYGIPFFVPIEYTEQTKFIVEYQTDLDHKMTKEFNQPYQIQIFYAPYH